MIDSLAAGFGIITRRPMLALLPVLLDILLLAAPGVTSEALPSRVHIFLSRVLTQGASSPDSMLATGVQLDLVRRSLEGWNLLAVLAWQVPTLSGPLMNARVADATPLGGGAASTLALLSGVAAASLLLGCLYLGRVARAVLRQTPAPSGQVAVANEKETPGVEPVTGALGKLGQNWLRLTGLRALQGGVLVTLLVIGVGLFSLGGGLAPGLVGVVFALALLALLFLFLAEESLFLGGMSILGAVAESIRVVRGYFGTTLGLWLLVSLIGIGLRIIWANISGNALGTVVAIVGNAYIATGLTAAVFVFYHDRRSVTTAARA